MTTPEREKKIKRVIANRRQDIIVILEDIYDPHNVESILRTCDAFGIHIIYLITHKQPPFNTKKLGKRSSASANKWLDPIWFDSIDTALRPLKEEGYHLYGTTINNTAKHLQQTTFTDTKTAILFGNERDGLSPEILTYCNSELYIPMNGMIDSLNISVSAAITLYEYTKQHPLTTKHQLPNKTQEKLINEFLQR